MALRRIRRSPRVFLCYRRNDAPGFAGRLHGDLVEEYGDDAVFRDITNMPYGVDFHRFLAETIARCDVLLLVIGPRWMQEGPSGSRLDEPADVLREEAATALKLGVPVIPVLVEEASMPPAARLPADLRPLAGLHAAVLSDSHWEYDLARLKRAIASLAREHRGDSGGGGVWMTWMRAHGALLGAGISAAVVAVVAALIVMFGATSGTAKAYEMLIAHLPSEERATCQPADGTGAPVLASANCHTGSYALYDSALSARNAILMGATRTTCNDAPSNLGKEYVHTWTENGRSGLFRCAVSSHGDGTVLIQVSWTFDDSPVYGVLTATSRPDFTTRTQAYWNLVRAVEAIRPQIS